MSEYTQGIYKDGAVMTCNCRSYNNPEISEGLNDEVVLDVPPSFGFTYPDGTPKTSISIDACIVHVIRRLWSKGVITMGCCCGHGESNPSIIFDNGMTSDQAENIAKIISQVDDRKFKILSWKLVDLSECAK